MSYSVKNQDLFNLIKLNYNKSRKEKIELLVNYLCVLFELPHDKARTQLSDRVSKGFLANLETKTASLKKLKKGINDLTTKYHDWLLKDFTFFYEIVNINDEHYEPAAKKGRPSVPYDNASDKTKSRIINTFRQSYAPEMIESAYKKNIEENNQKSQSKLLSFVINNQCSPILKKITIEQPTSMTPDDALMFLMQNNLSRNVYENIRKNGQAYNANIYPPYEQVLQAKRELLPTNIIVDERKCEVPLQDLVNQITKRLLSFVRCTKRANLIFSFKYGFDGTSTNAYKQKCKDPDLKSEEHIFCSTLVPLELRNRDTDDIIWINKKPNSRIFCSPIRLQFVKETKEVTVKEEEDLKLQISQLKCVTVGQCRVKFSFSLTMIDGKICSILSDVSNQKCRICTATIKDFNKIDEIVQKQINLENLEFGFSILHGRIRFLELVLHVSYRFDVKKWRITIDNEKETVKSRKDMIIRDVRQELGLLLDCPKQNHGSTNDDNTARRFFENYDTISRITGFDRTLLENIHTILTVISLGEEINVTAYRKFCEDTARLFVSLYPWYYLSTSTHLILMHSYLFIKNFDLPISTYSEEAQECRNKDIKQYRDNFSRKSSKIMMNQDIFERLLLTADIQHALKKNVSDEKNIAISEKMRSLLH